MPISHLGVGSGTTTPTADDTALETAIGTRMALAEQSLSGLVYTMTFDFGTGDNNGSWNEVATFSALTGGICCSHALFASTFTKDTSKTATIDYSFTLT